MLTEQQLEDRFSGIGGSDAAAVMGLSHRITARELYHMKRRELPDDFDDDDELARLGHLVEPALAQRYSERTGRRVRVVNGTRRHRRWPWMLAHPDRLVTGERRGLEIKMRVSGDGWGEEGSDQVPDEVLLQCQHYMEVHRFPVWDVIALIGGTGTRLYEIPRDPVIGEALVEQCHEFWQRIQRAEPPPLDYDHRTALSLIQRLHPGTDGRLVQLGEEFAHWAAVWREAREARERYQAAADAARAHIEAAMGDAAIGMLPDGSAFHRKERHRAAFSAEASSWIAFEFKTAPRNR